MLDMSGGVGGGGGTHLSAVTPSAPGSRMAPPGGGGLNSGAAVFRQGSGESSYSARSSDLSLEEEREHFRRDTERQALLQLDKARSKPVAFAVKTNVAFDGTLDDDSPVHGSAVSFAIGDYLHVMER